MSKRKHDDDDIAYFLSLGFTHEQIDALMRDAVVALFAHRLKKPPDEVRRTLYRDGEPTA